MVLQVKETCEMIRNNTQLGGTESLLVNLNGNKESKNNKNLEKF